MKNKIKKTLFAIALLISSCTFAQTKELYHIYKFDGKAGVTDTLNNDILPANYDGYVEELFGKKKWIFKTDNKTTIFNRENGTKEFVEKIRTYRFTYNNEMYMQITSNGKDYLLSHHSDKRFDLPKGRENIDTVGEYFYTSKMVSTKTKPVKDKKTGLLQPPKLSEPQNQFQFFKNPTDPKPVLEIVATKMDDLWKNKNYTNNFDYAAFTTEKQIKIYDNNLKLIKTIPKPNKEYIRIDDLVSEAIGQEIEHRGAPPSMAMGEPVEYPLLTIRKQNGKNQVTIEKEYADNNPTFLFTTDYEVSVRKNAITLKKEDKKFAEFDVNLNTGKIYYPKVYLDQLGLDFTQKIDTTIYENTIPSAGFAEGARAMLDFIKDNLIYPREVKKGKIEGTVIAKFVVEKDGNISDIKILKSLSKECDAEVIRVIEKMPKWKPAKKDGTIVRSYYKIPITFAAQ